MPAGLTTGAVLLLQLPVLWIITSAAWQFWCSRLQKPACEMTYMYPDFKPVYAPEFGLEPHQPHGYKLHAYVDHPYSPGKDQLVTPALFVPGNAGNYQQVRGLASETGRMWAALQAAYPGVPLKRLYIQWYSIDTVEELSAFNGQVLERQVQFMVSALRFLAHKHNLSATQQHRYNPGYRHPGVLLVGHSMGGVVARAAMLDAAGLPDLGPSTVALLLSLAAPLQRPPLPAHPSLQRFYTSRQGRGHTPWVPLISLSGHDNDTQVAHHLTSPVGVHPAPISLHVSTTGVPGAWLAPTHVSFMWCNQLIKPITRFLMEAAWQLHHELILVSDGHSREQPGNSTAQKRPSGHVTHISNASHVHHTSVVLAAARKHLLSRNLSKRLDSLLYQPPNPTNSGPSHETFSLDSLSKYQCSGANLVWYRQYSQPKLVTCKAGNAGGSTTAAATCIPTLHLRGTKAAAKLVKLNVTGQLHAWALDAHTPASATFLLRASSAAPCRSFRVWLHPARRSTNTTQAADEAAWNQPSRSASTGAQGQAAGGEVAGTAATGGGADPRSGAVDGVGDGDDQRLDRANQTADDPYTLTVSVGPDGRSETVTLKQAQARDADSTREPTDGSGSPPDAGAHQQRADADEVADAGKWMYSEGVEVTQLAAWLPPATAKARRVVRQWSDSDEILDGIDYNTTASWALVLPPRLLSQAAGITLWTGVPTNVTSFHFIAQLVQATHRAAAAATSSPTSPSMHMNSGPADVELTWKSFVQPVVVSTGSPAITSVQASLGMQPLEHQALRMCSAVSKTASGPWARNACHLVLQAVGSVTTSLLHVSGVLDHVALSVSSHVPDKRGGSSNRSKAVKRVVDTCMHTTVVLPCDVSGQPGSSACGNAAEITMSNQTYFNLGPCMSGAAGAQACRFVLLSDPGCGYHLSLAFNIAEQLPGLLLANMHVLWLMSLGWLLAIMAVQAYNTRDAGSWMEAVLDLHRSIISLLCNSRFLAASVLSAGLLMLTRDQLTADASADGSEVDGASSHASGLRPLLLRHTQLPGQQLSSLWISLLPFLTVLFVSRQQPGTGRSPSSTARTALAAVLGAATPWLLTSPRLSHHVSLQMSRLGLWVCSTPTCLSPHLPSPVELALLTGSSMVVVVLLHLATCILELLVKVAQKPFRKRACGPTPRAQTTQAADGTTAGSSDPQSDATADAQQGQRTVSTHGKPGWGVNSTVALSVLVLAATVVHLSLGLFISFIILLIRTQIDAGESEAAAGKQVVSQDAVQGQSVSSGTGKQQLLTGWTRVMALSVLITAPSGVAAVHEMKRHGVLMSDVWGVITVLPLALTAVMPVANTSRTQARLSRAAAVVQGLVGAAAACLACAVLGLDFAAYHIQCFAALLILLVQAMWL